MKIIDYYVKEFKENCFATNDARIKWLKKALKKFGKQMAEENNDKWINLIINSFEK